MISKEKWKEALSTLGELTEEQKAALEEAAGKPVSEKELYEKLGNIDEKAFAEFLKAASGTKEEAVFSQEVSAEEMASAAGGHWYPGDSDCTRQTYHTINYCAATVEDGSWCRSNDACYSDEVRYVEMQRCQKAWK